jgi:hypothetical protein
MEVEVLCVRFPALGACSQVVSVLVRRRVEVIEVLFLGEFRLRHLHLQNYFPKMTGVNVG